MRIALELSRRGSAGEIKESGLTPAPRPQPHGQHVSERNQAVSFRYQVARRFRHLYFRHRRRALRKVRQQSDMRVPKGLAPELL